MICTPAYARYPFTAGWTGGGGGRQGKKNGQCSLILRVVGLEPMTHGSKDKSYMLAGGQAPHIFIHITQYCCIHYQWLNEVNKNINNGSRMSSPPSPLPTAMPLASSPHIYTQ